MRNEAVLLHSLWLGHACLVSVSLEQLWYYPLFSPCFSLEAVWQVLERQRAEFAIQDGFILDLRAETQGFPFLSFVPWFVFPISWCT